MGTKLQVAFGLVALSIRGDRSSSMYSGFLDAALAWNQCSVPSRNGPREHFARGCVPQGVINRLTQCTQGAQQQWRGLIGRQRGRAIGLAQLVTVWLCDQGHMQ